MPLDTSPVEFLEDITPLSALASIRATMITLLDHGKVTEPNHAIPLENGPQ
jgi:hypothetical protein